MRKRGRRPEEREGGREGGRGGEQEEGRERGTYPQSLCVICRQGQRLSMLQRKNFSLEHGQSSL